MKERITEQDIEAIASSAMDSIYRYLTIAGFSNPQAFINESAKARELEKLQTLEKILVEFIKATVREEERIAGS